MTVVLDLKNGRSIVGRYHDTEAGRMRLHDVAMFDPAAGRSREEFLARTLKFGVKAEAKFLAVPADEVERITPLHQLAE